MPGRMRTSMGNSRKTEKSGSSNCGGTAKEYILILTRQDKCKRKKLNILI